MSEVEGVEQSPVHDDAVLGPLNGELRDERQMELSSAIAQQFSESVTNLGLIVEVKLAKLVERGVIGLHRGVRRLESKRHVCGGGRASLQRNQTILGSNQYSRSPRALLVKERPAITLALSHVHPSQTRISDAAILKVCSLTNGQIGGLHSTPNSHALKILPITLAGSRFCACSCMIARDKSFAIKILRYRVGGGGYPRFS